MAINNQLYIITDTTKRTIDIGAPLDPSITPTNPSQLYFAIVVQSPSIPPKK